MFDQRMLVLLLAGLLSQLAGCNNQTNGATDASTTNDTTDPVTDVATTGDGAGTTTTTSTSGDQTDTTTSGTTQDLGGVLLVPKSMSASASSSKPMSYKMLAAASTACPPVPAGYAPLPNATLRFFNVSGEEVQTGQTFTTDACGAFDAPVPTSVVSMKASATNYKDVDTEVAVFKNGNGRASTISNAAQYEIGSLQKTGDGSLAFSVTDDLTKKAVIGIPSSAISVTVNGNPVSITDMTDASLSGGAASIVLVMDASLSMDSPFYTDPATQVTYNGYQLAANAAHGFLDAKGPNDEAAVLIFSQIDSFMDDATISSLFTLQDRTTSAPASYAFSADGFTTDAAKLRFIIDAYDHDSTYWPNGSDPVHSDSPDVVITSTYPWSDSTRLYENIDWAIDKVSARLSPRKIIVAMTDGKDTYEGLGLNDPNYPFTRDKIVAKAEAAGVPIYTVGFNADAVTTTTAAATDQTALTYVADNTGGSYIGVQGKDIAGAFESIQTGIVFQYLANIDTTLTSGDQVEITINHNGVTATRGFTVN